MQVKKFEARSMKEALEMAKAHLGPDAIILSAREISKGFGLVGDKSYEITAAITDETLRKKQFVESKLRSEDKERFIRSTARSQKQVIDHVVSRQQQAKEPEKTITRTPYIDIRDESGQSGQPHDAASERIKNAASRAFKAMKETEALQFLETKKTAELHSSKEITALKDEIKSLKQAIESFKQTPSQSVINHPGAQYGLNYELSSMFQKLNQVGVYEDVSAEILLQLQSQVSISDLKKPATASSWIAKFILGQTQVNGDQNLAKVHCFMGPAGQGKTSALVKLASHLVVSHKKKVLLLTTDTFKVGSVDQLRIYSQILNVPFNVIRSQMDWERFAPHFGQFDAVLVDFPGLGLTSMDELKLVKNLLPPASVGAQNHLVLSALNKYSDLLEMARRYRLTEFKDVAFSNLDESMQNGVIFSFHFKTKIPLFCFGTGPKIPEDFEFATKERVLDLVFRLTSWKNKREDLHGTV